MQDKSDQPDQRVRGHWIQVELAAKLSARDFGSRRGCHADDAARRVVEEMRNIVNIINHPEHGPDNLDKDTFRCGGNN